MEPFRNLDLPPRAEQKEYRGYTLESVKEFPYLYRAMYDGKEAKALGWFNSEREGHKAIDEFLNRPKPDK